MKYKVHMTFIWSRAMFFFPILFKVVPFIVWYFTQKRTEYLSDSEQTWKWQSDYFFWPRRERVKSGPALLGRARQLSITSLLLGQAAGALGALPVNIFGPQSLKIFSLSARELSAVDCHCEIFRHSGTHWHGDTVSTLGRRPGHQDGEEVEHSCQQCCYNSICL